MTQNNPEQAAEFSEEDVRAAEAAEQAALSASQNKYLTRRVVVLRAQLNRVEAENSELRLKLHELESDEQKEDPQSEE